jgi:hypothetical protein
MNLALAVEVVTGSAVVPRPIRRPEADAAPVPLSRDRGTVEYMKELPTSNWTYSVDEPTNIFTSESFVPSPKATVPVSSVVG